MKCGCVASWCELDLTFDPARVFSPVVLETYFCYHQDIWIAATVYCTHFYLIVLFPSTADTSN